MDKLSRLVEALEQSEASQAAQVSWRTNVESKYKGKVEKRGRRFNLSYHRKNLTVDESGNVRFAE